MKTKHTKGEWKVREFESNGKICREITFNDDGECVAEHVHNKDDAKLIAAAPVMINDLVDEVDFLEGLLNDSTNKLPEAVRNTIRFRVIELKKTIKKATA